MIDFSNPWSILGWLIIFVIALCFLSVIVQVSRQVFSGVRQANRDFRAQKGKVTCEAPGCKNKAAYLTPLGYYCKDDRSSHDTKKTYIGSFSWSKALEWTKK